MVWVRVTQGDNTKYYVNRATGEIFSELPHEVDEATVLTIKEADGLRDKAGEARIDTQNVNDKNLGGVDDLQLESTAAKLTTNFGDQIGEDEQKIEIGVEVVEQDRAVLQEGLDSEKDRENASCTTRHRQFANIVKYMHLTFLVLGLLFLVALGIQLLVIHHNSSATTMTPLLLSGIAFTVPCSILLTYIRRTVTEENVPDKMGILILFVIFAFVQLGIIPIVYTYSEEKEITLGYLLSSTIFGLILSIWVTHADNTFFLHQLRVDGQYRIRESSLIVVAILVAFPLAILLPSMLISKFKVETKAWLPLCFTLSFTSIICIYSLLSARLWYNKEVRSTTSAIKKRRMVITSTIKVFFVCATIAYPIFHLLGAGLFRNSKTFEIELESQIMLLILAIGMAAYIGFNFLHRKATRRYITWKNSWIVFTVYILSVVLPIPFLLPLPFLRETQESSFFGIFFSIFLFGVMLCFWTSLVVFKLNSHKTKLFENSKNKKDGKKVLDSNKIQRVATLYNMDGVDKEYLKKIWMIPTIVYILCISYSLPLLLTMQLSETFSTTLLGKKPESIRNTKETLLSIFLLGFGHLLFHSICQNNTNWRKRSKYNRIIDSIIYHVAIVVPMALIHISLRDDNKDFRDFFSCLAIVGVLYFILSTFYNSKLMWKYSVKERWIALGLYILLIAIPAPIITLYWMPKNGVSETTISDGVIKYMHTSFILGLLWLSVILYARTPFVMQRHKDLQLLMIFVFAIPGSIPLSLLYVYMNNYPVLITLICISAGSFHLILILALVGKFWPKFRFVSATLFVCVCTIFVIIPVWVIVYRTVLNWNLNVTETQSMLSLLIIGVMLLTYILVQSIRPKIENVFGRHLVNIFIYKIFFVLPIASYPLYPKNLAFIALLVLSGCQAFAWEYYDRNHVAKWKTSWHYRIFLCAAFHILIALPLALLIVGYKDSVTTFFSDFIFLPFCMSIGVLAILFSRLYFVHLRQYNEPFQALFMILCSFCSMLLVMCTIQMRYDAGLPCILEICVLISIPVFVLGAHYYHMWPIRFVDKFVCLTILGILTPFLTALQEGNIFVARDARLFFYLGIAFPASVFLMMMLPRCLLVFLIKLPTAINVAISGIFLPFGAMLPVYFGMRENGRDESVWEILSLMLVIALPLMTMLCFILTHFIKISGRLRSSHLRNVNQRRKAGKTASAKRMSAISDWTMHVVMLFALIFLLLVERYISNVNSSYSIWVIITFSPIIYISNNRKDTVAFMEKHHIGVIAVLTSLCFAGAITVFSGQFANLESISSIGLVVLIIIPGMSGTYLLLRSISKCIHLHPDPKRTMTILSLACCLGVFLPFGVILPSVLSTDWQSNKTFAELLLLTVSVLALICLVDVSSFTIGINSTFNSIQKERRAKAAAKKITEVAKLHNFYIDTDIARNLYDEAVERKSEWLKFEEDVKAEKVLQRLQRNKRLYLIDSITLQEGIDGRQYKLCPVCDELGWKVQIKRGKKLCKTCMIEKVLKEKKELTKKKAENEAIKLLNEKHEAQRLEKLRKARRDRKIRFRKGVLDITQCKYKNACETLTKLIEEDDVNADYLYHRSICLLQLKRFNEALLDANEAIAIQRTFAEAYGAKASCLAAEHRWIEAIETYRVGLQFCRGNKALLEGLEVVKKAKLVHSSEDGIFKYLFARVNSIGSFFHRTNTIIDSVLSQNNNENQGKRRHSVSDVVAKGGRGSSGGKNLERRGKLYDGCVFRIQIVDIKGLDTTGLGDIHELLPIKCHIYIDSKGKKNRFSRYTCALSDVNNLVWHNEFLFLQWWACKQDRLRIDVLGKQHGKSYVLATNYIEGHQIGRYSRQNKYVHVPMVFSGFLNVKFEVGLSCGLINKRVAVQTLHSQYNADFIRGHFVVWKKLALSKRKSRMRVYKEIYMHYCSKHIPKSNKKRRVSSIAIRQVSFRSQKRELLLQMERNIDPQKNDLDASSGGNESNSEDIIIRRSSTVVNSGKISQKQFEVFVADSMTTEYSPSKLFFEEAKKNARRHEPKARNHFCIDFKQFCRIIRTIAKRRYSTMPMEDAEQLMVDEVYHNCLPMYTKWKKIHGLRVLSKSTKIEDPRHRAQHLHMTTSAASLIQKWWRRKQRRKLAAKALQRWYRRRKVLREQYPERLLNRQLIELINEKEDEDTDENQIIQNRSSDTSKGIPKSFSCLKNLLVSFESTEEDTKISPIPITNSSKEIPTIKTEQTKKANNLSTEEEKYKVIIEEINKCRVKWDSVANVIFPVLHAEVSKIKQKSDYLNTPDQTVNWKMWDNLSTFYIGMIFTAYQYISVALTHGPLAETSEKAQNVTASMEESTREQLKKQLSDSPWVMRLLDLLIYIPQFKLPDEFGNSFHIFFWFSIIIAVAFPFYALKGLKALQKGRLGLDDNGRQITSCCSKDGLYNFGLNAVNDYLYFGMMFTLISAYACSYDEASHQFILMADEEMKCFTFSEPLQIIYMLVSSIGLVGFYPLATLLAPNFQFNNKALDIKYEQSFLIMEHQAELLMAGFSIFYQEEWTKVLVPQLIICLTLAASNHYLQPCLVKRLNIFRTGIYLSAAHTCACAIMYHMTRRNGLLTWVSMLGGWIIMWTLILCMYKRNKKQIKISKVLPMNNVAADADTKGAGDSQNAKTLKSGEEGKVERKSVVMPAERVDNEIDP